MFRKKKEKKGRVGQIVFSFLEIKGIVSQIVLVFSNIYF